MSELIDVMNNGLMVMARPMSHMESVSFGIWIKAGARYETPGNNGINGRLKA